MPALSEYKPSESVDQRGEGDVVASTRRTVGAQPGDRDFDADNPRLPAVLNPIGIEVVPHRVAERRRALIPEIRRVVEFTVRQGDRRRSVRP